jgi:hypothetical protein
MAHVLQHLHRGGLDVDFLAGDAERLHERPRVGLGALGSGEAGHGETEDVRARQFEHVEGPRGHEQRMRRVEAAGDADHHALAVGDLQALHQSLHLDVECLVAVGVQAQRIVRHEGKAIDLALEARIDIRRFVREGDSPERVLRIARRHRRRVEGDGAHALLAQPLHIHVGHHHLALHREALVGRQQRSQLMDRGLPVPCEVGRAFARPGRREDVRRDAAHRLGLAEHGALVGLADHRIRGRQVAQDQRARERAADRRRRRGPEVLADLDVEDEVSQVAGREDEVGAERAPGVPRR